MAVHMKFTHLHVHSSYSSQDGMIKPKDLVEECIQKGFSAACITDHGNLRGIPHLWKAAQGKIKCILGMEAYYVPHSRHLKDAEHKSAQHLVLLAKNQQGWKNLVKLSSRSFLEGFYYHPRIDWELLDALGDGLIVLSACAKGPICQNILEEEKALEVAKQFAQRFGEDFYVEIQAHQVVFSPGFSQDLLNQLLIAIARKLGLPLVVTTDAHFLKQESYKAHQALVALARGMSIKELQQKEGHVYGPWFYLQTPEEVQQYIPADFAYEAILNTELISLKVEEFSIGLNNKKPYLMPMEK